MTRHHRSPLSVSEKTQEAAVTYYPWSAPGYKSAAVSQLPDSTQRLVFIGLFVVLGSSTVLTCSLLGPLLAQYLPSFLMPAKSSGYILGPIFMAAGIGHFIERQGFVNMYPHKGAWGCWYLPGSAEFHVYWTGVAELLGGLGLLLGAIPFDSIPGWLSPASAYGLLILTVVVTPANIYMYTHNAPGPLPKKVLEKTGGVLSVQQHFGRGVMQVVLLSVLWGIAKA